ncbi:MAG TPA: flavin reductase family protein [Streptosporangiaceae bacterium]|jgi:flavin reductase (DIM6/NTAB) family NADH-FMN oxidoreductase RutF
MNVSEVMQRVATSVSIVTTVDSSGLACGVTVGTLCWVSFTPPLVMFCLDRSGRSYRVLTAADRVLVHVLGDDQAEIAARFARTDLERFDGMRDSWHGLPTIPDTALRLACARYQVVAGGDHTIVICLVEDAETGSADPLLYYAHGYCAALPVTVTAALPPRIRAARAGCVARSWR